ncbi:MAG: Epoxyqueuosine reductase [Phycisphaerae bacterium]|nr:Epoxyqueuosine reductase [Phycisphaerae bacterium]
MSPADRSTIVKRLAHDAGFDRAGVTPAARLPQAEYYRNWIAAGHHGTMDYLARHVETRADPRTLLDGAQSIICLAINYRRPPENIPPAGGAATGRVAQYARGQDYHTVLHTLLDTLISRLRTALDTPFDARPFVDTGPLLERSLAAQAGLGWIGKNTCLMHPALGSYLFLGEIITTLELAPDNPMPDHCGSCTRCLEACPTQAFIAPYQLDASRCIAYLTIERREPFPDALAGRVGEWVFGCDICQEVCPHNSAAPYGTHAGLMADRTPGRLPLPLLSEMRSGDYRRLTRGTALGRASRAMWQRNARQALAAQQDTDQARTAD